MIERESCIVLWGLRLKKQFIMDHITPCGIRRNLYSGG
jgi:hypothetical protein